MNEMTFSLNCEKNETLWKQGYPYNEWGDFLASIEKKAKAIAFGTSRRMKVIKK